MSDGGVVSSGGGGRSGTERIGGEAGCGRNRGGPGRIDRLRFRHTKARELRRLRGDAGIGQPARGAGVLMRLVEAVAVLGERQAEAGQENQQCQERRKESRRSRGRRGGRR
jgi:hypothetical protein